MKHHKWGVKSEALLMFVGKDVVKLCNLALEISEYDFSIIRGFASAKEQNKLFKKGVTECDGYEILSAHQNSLAVDILPWVKDRNGSTMNMYNYNDPKVLLIWQEVIIAFRRAARLLNLNIECGDTYLINGIRDFPHIAIIK